MSSVCLATEQLPPEADSFPERKRVSAEFASTETWFLVSCGLVVALSLALGLYRLGEPSVWFDEAASWETIRSTWKQFWGRVQIGEDSGGCAYAFLLRITCSLVGTSEFGLRLPSVIAGTATVVLMLAMGYSLWGRKAALCVGLLMALHPEVVCWSRQARAYSLELFAATLCLACLLVPAKIPPKARAIVLGAAASLAVLAHAFGIFFVIGAAFFVGCSRLPRRTAGKYGADVQASLRPLAGALLVSVVWMIALQSRIRHNLDDFWIRDSILKNYFIVFRTNLPLVPVYAMLLLLGVFLLVRNRWQARNRAVLGVLVFVLVPVLGGPLMVSALGSGRHNFILARYFLSMIPLCLLPLGYTLSRLPSWYGILASLGLGIGALWGSHATRLYDKSGYDGCDNRAALECLASKLQAGDRVIVYPGHQLLALEYYKLPASQAESVWHAAELPSFLKHRESGPTPTWLAIYFVTDAELRALGLASRPRWDFGALHIVQVE